MSCACENKRFGQEKDRIRRLAKAWAKMENKTAVIIKNEDGTYIFIPAPDTLRNDIVEYVTPY